MRQKETFLGVLRAVNTSFNPSEMQKQVSVELYCLYCSSYHAVFAVLQKRAA